MKAFWRLLKVIGAVMVGFTAVRMHLDKLIEFLTFFAEDKHAEGWAWLRDDIRIRPLFDNLPAEKQIALNMAGPMIFEWIDVALPEEPVLAFLAKIKAAID